MKNFTNNFKQFTSRLSARWLIMALMMLVGTSSAWAAAYLSGDFNSWGAQAFSNGTCSISLNANTTYYFKIRASNSNWNTAYGNSGVMTDTNCTDWLMSTSAGNCGITTKAAGTYIFSFNESTKKLSVTYPAPPVSKTYKGTIKFKRPSSWANTPHIHMFYDGSNTLVDNKTMTKEGVDASGNTWYKYDYSITTTFTTATIMFNNGGWNNGQTAEQFKGDLGTDYCLASATSTTSTRGNVTTATCPVYCTPPAAPTLNPNSTTVCSGTSFNLPSGYRWYTVATGGTKLSSNTISAGVTAKTIYYAEAGEDGCVSTSRTAYTVNVDPKSALELENPTICQGSSIVLSDYVSSSTGTVKWYSNSARTTEITNPSVARTPQSNPTYYYARATSGVCSSVDKTLTVTLSPQPAITLKAAPTICNGTTVTFADYVNTHTGTVTWHTKSDFSDAAITSAKPNATTTYYAKATSGNCTPATASLKVTVNNKPAVPTLSADKTSLVSPDKATLTAGNTTNGLTYTLYNGETPGESQKSTGGTLNFKVGEAGNYTVRVSNSCGTSTSDVVTITVCTPQTNEFRHANSSYVQQQAQPTYYPGDKAYFVSTITCCLTGTWSANLQKGEEPWYTGLTGGTPRFYMTLTRAGNFTITNMATNNCTQDKNVLVNLDFTVTALSQVTNANGTASGADIALTWKHSTNHTKVMVVRYPTAGTETIPAGGQSYSAGNTLGEGTVVYVGTSESYTDKSLPSGESYKYYFYTVNNNYYSDGVVLNMSSCPIPAKPNLSSTAITACNGECTAQGYITINNMNDYKDDTYTFKLGSSVVTPDANGRLGINSTAYTQYTVTVTNSCGNPNSATVDIAINDNKPTITGNNSFQPGGSTTLTSDKGASTTWLALDGGDLNTRTGASVVFTAKDKGTYHVQATYNGCSTTYTIKVQDDLYVWVRRPIKKETAYDQFYHKDQNSDASKGGDLFYKEFASLPGDYQQYNQGGKAADDKCTDKDGYTWYGFVVSKTAIENDYYFTVHAPNDKGYGGYHTHTYATQLVDMDADLYFVMDETPSNVNRGWNINTPVVVRASGDAMFNGNNFADFVPLYVKDANICGKEVVSFEWQKSTTQNGAYTTYNGKSGKGINNIRTREAGWYRCVVTYGDGKGTATSNAIQVTNTTSGTPGKLADFSSKLPVIMVNTNGVGFPSDKNLATKNTKCASGKRYPSLYADDLKEKVTVDVIIKKGNEILYDRKARMNYRGSSSLNFKKKSYAFCSAQDSCVFDKGRHDYVKTKKEKMLNLLGDENYKTSDKDWVLYAATPDPSMMRNRLVFDLYQQMRPNDWGVHSTYVELIVDGEYRGVYVFMDKITANEKRVNITNENGFIVKFDKTDVVDRVENAEGDQKTFATSRTGTKSNENGIESYGACIDQRFEIEYPEKEDIEDAGGNWEAFYTKVQKRFEDFETALAAQKYDEVRTIIDYDSWADWFIISEFIKNQDGFRASNLFVYNGGKIMAMPLWDQELSMDNRTRIAHGSNSTEGLLTTTASVYTDAFPATFWFTGGGANITGGLLNDPCFVSLVKEKWASYQLGALSTSNITTLVNKYHAELDDNIRKREVTKWPYTEESRGKTTDGDYMGYYAEGDANHYNYQTSKQAIIDFAGGRSTELGASTSGLGQALYGLNGKALIFTISPSLIETTPWQPSIFTVNAPEGYVYTLDYSELTEADAIIKENGNVYTFKIPRPNDWGTGGNGEEKSVNYRVTATIDADGENSCGTQHANTATLNVEFSDVTEDCETPIEPQP